MPKSGNNWRICFDLTKLNKFVKRPHHPMITPREAINGVPHGSRYFSTLDAVHGYWQIELEEESQDLTTFITPFGRFKFLRNPMGLPSAQDEYGRTGDEAIAGLTNMVKVVNDILVYFKTAQELVDSIVALLDHP